MSNHPRWLLLIVLVAPSAAEEAPPSGYQPLRPISACLDPGRARSIALQGNDRLLVDAGRRHFLIELAWACPQLGNLPELRFEARNPTGRICGDVGDAVTRPQPQRGGLDRCPISRIQPISRDEYRAELTTARARVSVHRGR